MERRFGSLFDCMGRISHQVAHYQIKSMVRKGEFSAENVLHHLEAVYTDVDAAVSQIRMIRSLAAKKGYADVTELLEKEIVIRR